MTDEPEIRESNVRAIRFAMICPMCGQEMQATGQVLLSFPSQYPHMCPCGFKHVVVGESFPKIEYRQIMETDNA